MNMRREEQGSAGGTKWRNEEKMRRRGENDVGRRPSETRCKVK